MLERLRNWLMDRRRRIVIIALGRSTRALHSAATDLYRIRGYYPEKEERINSLLDEVMYPTIRAIEELEKECLTLPETEEQSLTLTLVK